ncbi:MAG: creatininase family protein [Gammaproteobacteria bacterium]
MHGFVPPHRYLPYLTAAQVAALPAREATVVIQPVAAVEQHGAHLPIVTDAAIAEGVVGAALERLDDNVPAFALPPLFYGKSNEHFHFPGTITLTAQTLLQVLMEVGASVYRSGFRKLIFANAHGGQPQLVQVAARDLHLEHADFQLFPLGIWSVPNEAMALIPEPECSTGIHGGDAETSLMLALLQEQVQFAEARAETPPALPDGALLSVEGARPFAWVTRDLSASGVVGDPTGATVEKGRALLDGLASGWAQVIGEVHRFEPPRVGWMANPEAGAGPGR